jgi:two-component system chemotaxis response regulator CheB
VSHVTAFPHLSVLVVDDSALYRQMVKHVISSIEGADVIGTASDGREAVEQIALLRPDLVTLDVQMPNLDGLGTLRELKRRSLQPLVVMVSSLTAQGAPETVEALLHGAIDCILKPAGLEPHLARNELRQALQARIAAILSTRQNISPIPVSGGEPVGYSRAGAIADGDCIAIGASTGGPEALRKVLVELSGAGGPPVFIVQHMPATFTESLARRLDEIAPLPVHLAATGMVAEPGHAYLAPGGFHLTAVRRGHGVICKLSQTPTRQGCRPSMDALLESLVDVYGERIVAAILTGMGCDGLAGCRAVKAAGGTVVAQNRESCTVYGMPKAVIDAGLADVVLPLDAIGKLLAGSRSRQLKSP